MDNEKFKKSFKTRLFTGLFITFPLILTILALKWLFVFLDGILGNVLYRVLGHEYTGLGLALAFLLVLGVGTLATTVLGRAFLNRTERVMLSLPIVKSFYSTFKQLADAFSPSNRGAFKKFVIVEYPRLGVHSFGFLTKECVIKAEGGNESCYNTVYIPTNNLYLGEIVLFRKEEVIVTDLAIDEGIKIILSAGIAAPSVIEKDGAGSARAHHAVPVPLLPSAGEAAQ